MPGNNNTTIVITPPKGLVQVDWSELWRYRELLYTFAWRDIKYLFIIKFEVYYSWNLSVFDCSRVI